MFLCLQKIVTKEDGKHLDVNVQFSWYGTTNKRDKSGAYLFLPDGSAKVGGAGGSGRREKFLPGDS